MTDDGDQEAFEDADDFDFEEDFDDGPDEAPPRAYTYDATISPDDPAMCDLLAGGRIEVLDAAALVARAH